MSLFVLLAIGPSAAQEVVPRLPITERMYATPEAYFEGQHRDLLRASLGGAWAVGEVDIDPGSFEAFLYVPPSYTPDGTWGAYVHISASADGDPKDSWDRPLEDNKLVYIGPHEIGNSVSVPTRMAVALDALATLRARYELDPDRLVVGGFSGGAATAVMTGAHYPDVFVGTVDQSRAVMWEHHEISTIPGSIFGLGEIDHLDPDGLDSVLRRHRFAFVSGDQDVLYTGGDPFSNYEGIMDGIGDWWARGLRARVWDVPGHGHRKSDPLPFGLALHWVLDCTDTADFPPRFDTDHAPPATPFPAPASSAPEACDAVEEPDPDPEGDPGGADAVDDAGGCGCDGTGGAAWVWPLAVLAVGARRRI